MHTVQSPWCLVTNSLVDGSCDASLDAHGYVWEGFLSHVLIEKMGSGHQV